jgi:hypothetical protein
MLLAYGILILVSGLSEWSHPSNTVLSELHAPVWWGGILTVIGAAYVLAFRPKKS